ncbi:universal stress protein [Halostagnicola kamekurae]|uniref:Nucleotide-binding universal stress protein, UspA family n=1 Tax=Halostagnicola kamekurae TaxID=619731 RepID=A0A1I6TEH9_9EURY|nr:universal stress protein [Halostagnicola kamekurae]SFS87586.1 Nucleotide-binding universal stress protein, UspA family [Halostagnicola kamekurae]
MISRILVPMDGSEMAERALEYALENHPDADVTVLHSVGGPTMMMGQAVALALEDDLEEAAHERAEPIFERAREIAARRDRTCDTIVEIGHPVRPIVERSENYDTVVLGSHGKHSEGVTRQFLVGNVAKMVFQRAPVPVTFVR